MIFFNLLQKIAKLKACFPIISFHCEGGHDFVHADFGKTAKVITFVY